MKIEQMDRPNIIRKCISEITDASPRACAIVAAALLDDILRTLLKDCFGTVQQPKDPVDTTTFDAKINLANRIGILEKGERDILHKINEIRNIFAHDLHANSFEYRKIRTKILELKKTEMFYSIINNPQKHYEPPGGWNECRNVFEFAVYYMLSFLLNIKIEPLKIKIKPKFTTIIDYIYDNIEHEKKPS